MAVTKRPTKVSVLGQPFQIRWQCPDNANLLGHTDSHKLEIEVKPNAAEAVARSTLLHELIHAVTFIQLDQGLTEQQVLALEVGLFQVFTQNTKVRDWVFGTGQRG